MEIKLCASTHFTKGYVVLYSLSEENWHQCEDAPERSMQQELRFPLVTVMCAVPDKSSEDRPSSQQLNSHNSQAKLLSHFWHSKNF